MWYLYALDDPRTGARRYVGQTKDIARRFRTHLAAKGKTHCARWVRSVCRDGSCMPSLRVLAVVMFVEEAKRLECAYIARLRARGADLTNLTDGGDGIAGYQHTLQTRAAISRTQREQFAAGRQGGMYGRRHTQEVRMRISKTNKESHGTAESRELSRQHMKAVRARKTWIGHGSSHSDVAKAKMRAAKLGRHLSLSHRMAIAAAVKAARARRKEQESCHE